MIFIGIVCIVFLFCFYRWANIDETPIVFIFTVPVLMFCSMLTFTLPPTKTPIEPYVLEIVSMKQNRAQNINGGGCFLGWGVNSRQELQYLIMMRLEDGRMVRKSLDQTSTYIVECDGKPRVEFPQERHSYSKWIHFPTFWDCEEEYYYSEKATIYVPKGTVAVRFEEI